ncbi:MAG TPA: OsmC family peroxiredoxin [Bacteroidetes bacterium]|nr:OsmC family peroxiredoxin [Bacteroidota bacterium]
MKVFLKQVQGITMTAKADSNHWVMMDGSDKFGGSKAASAPMEMMLMGLAGCTGMDVISILDKMRVKLDQFVITVDADRAPEHPKVFTRIHLKYYFWGDDVPEDKVKRAIELSQTKYCSASVMMKKTADLTYSYHINEEVPEEEIAGKK